MAQAPTRPSDYAFDNRLEFREANALKEAIDAALDAMAYYGSDEDHMATLSLVKIQVLRELADGFKRNEAKRALEPRKVPA